MSCSFLHLSPKGQTAPLSIYLHYTELLEQLVLVYSWLPLCSQHHRGVPSSSWFPWIVRLQYFLEWSKSNGFTIIPILPLSINESSGLSIRLSCTLVWLQRIDDLAGERNGVPAHGSHFCPSFSTHRETPWSDWTNPLENDCALAFQQTEPRTLHGHSTDSIAIVQQTSCS